MLVQTGFQCEFLKLLQTLDNITRISVAAKNIDSCLACKRMNPCMLITFSNLLLTCQKSCPINKKINFCLY